MYSMSKELSGVFLALGSSPFARKVSLKEALETVHFVEVSNCHYLYFQIQKSLSQMTVCLELLDESVRCDSGSWTSKCLH